VAVGGDHTVAVKDDDSLWAWGWNLFGQLGDPAIYLTSTPVLIGSDFSAVAAGTFHTIALKNDGSLWAWGDNAYGQLGDGTTADAHQPVQIGSGFAAIATGSFHTAALKDDGSLWAWGFNIFGETAGEWLTESWIPVRIGAGHAAVAAGGFHTLALRSDGSLWAWGFNFDGELGSGLFVDATAPQLVVNAALDGFLDLDAAAPDDIPTAAIPPFLAKVSKRGNLRSLSLGVDVRGMLDLGRSRAAARSGSYNLYVAAQAGVGGSPTWFQLDAGRRWSVLDWPMAAFMTGVTLSSRTDSVLVEILDGADVSGLVGARVYVGYGSDAAEMLGAGRYREVMRIAEPGR
jgi:hypothetical protein